MHAFSAQGKIGAANETRQFGTMTEKVSDYEKLLKSLLDRVDEADARLIRASLDKVRFCTRRSRDLTHR